jgi:hypothetical protein
MLPSVIRHDQPGRTGARRGKRRELARLSPVPAPSDIAAFSSFQPWFQGVLTSGKWRQTGQLPQALAPEFGACIIAASRGVKAKNDMT